MSGPSPRRRPRWLTGALVEVARRPWLWKAALRQIVLLAPPRWWARWPFLPLPDPDYLRFRVQTMYGDPDRDPAPADVVSYLTWCRQWPLLVRRRR